jgi:hypothetical protein
MQYSIGTVRGDFYGARATLNVWSPQVESRGEFSLAQIWVLSDDQDLHNTLEAGWQACQILISLINYFILINPFFFYSLFCTLFMSLIVHSTCKIILHIHLIYYYVF